MYNIKRKCCFLFLGCIVGYYCVFLDNNNSPSTEGITKTTRRSTSSSSSISSSSSSNDSNIVDALLIETSSSMIPLSYQMAYNESFGYFDDIPEKDWELMRDITMNRINNKYPNHVLYQRENPRAWYQNNWNPDFSCRHMSKVGGVGDGGKWICDPLRIREQSIRRKAIHDKVVASNNNNNDNNNKENYSGCIVYSVGSYGDFDFETSIAELLGPGTCEIHSFDFTNYEDKVPPGLNIHFHHWGLQPSYVEPSKRTSDLWFRTRFGQEQGMFGRILGGLRGGGGGGAGRQPLKTFEETVRELGHEGRPIDIFKIDCEGCEWGTYKDWIHGDIRQLLVEVHRAPMIANDFFLDLQQAGYVTYQKEPNTEYAGGDCVEYSMIKLTSQFVEDRIGHKGG